MKILFLTLGDETTASSRTRVHQYVPHLSAAGIRCTIAHCGGKATTRLALLKVLLLAPFHDVVFVQKVLLPVGYQWVLCLLNRNLVFDFDDAIYASGPGTTERQRVVHRPRLEPMLRRSRLVVLENEETAAFAAPFGCRILRITGPIDTNRYLPRRREASQDARPIVIGWIGSPSTTPYLQALLPCLKRLAVGCSQFELKVIGAQRFESEGVPVRFADWTLATEVEELSAFDIGIMPMPDDPWTRGKGGYKLLQYMAMGIPAVASPVGINAALIQHEVNGLLAATEDEWTTQLERLIEDAGLRARLGERGRRTVEDAYSFHHYAPLLIEALEILRRGL